MPSVEGQCAKHYAMEPSVIAISIKLTLIFAFVEFSEFINSPSLVGKLDYSQMTVLNSKKPVEIDIDRILSNWIFFVIAKCL